jgi:hypothetical protein
MPIGFDIVTHVGKEVVTVLETEAYTDILMPRTGEFIRIFMDHFWSQWHVVQVVHLFPQAPPGITHTLVVQAVGQETEAWLKDRSHG